MSDESTPAPLRLKPPLRPAEPIPVSAPPASPTASDPSGSAAPDAPADSPADCATASSAAPEPLALPSVKLRLKNQADSDSPTAGNASRTVGREVPRTGASEAPSASGLHKATAAVPVSTVPPS